MTELMMECYDSPDEVKTLIGKATEFIENYIEAFKTGTPDDINKAVQNVYDECSEFDNFMLSSGCDIPYDAHWENINAYFKKVETLYA